MKLRQITGTTPSKSKVAPTIRIGYLNGSVRFNCPTTEMLDLKEGDALAFYQDEENPKNWYFAKENGGSVLKPQGKGLYIYNAGIARGLLQSLGMHETAGFYVSESLVEGKYRAILTDKTI